MSRTPFHPQPLGTAAVLALPLVLFLASASSDEHPPSRALSLELTSAPRLAGTSGSLRAAKMVRRHLEEAGWEVEFDEREVVLSLPRFLALGLYTDVLSTTPFHERLERFDADAIPAGDIPKFNAWSASAEVRGQVIDAGYGSRSDFDRLVKAGVDPKGKVALCRYGKGYRGVKVDLATQFGCIGVLLFSDPADDGAEKGETWPKGPWKPEWEAQRGSISPMGRTPGDPSTPDFASPAPGEDPPEGRTRLSGKELDALLPTIPCLPIGAAEAAQLLERLAVRRMTDSEGQKKPETVGPGPVEARLVVDAPREVRRIRNVIARLTGENESTVIAGNHRDAWVRGANDAGGGTVALIRAAQHLGERARTGWRPRHTITLCFWDGEEQGLIGSTEWAEDNATWLRENTLCYLNADAAVSGTLFRASGTPGLLSTLEEVLSGVHLTGEEGSPANLWEQWAKDGEPRLSLPGSGSDFAVFLHHLNLPVLDIGFGGNRGGHYHTAFDDFSMMERYLDPGFVGHELAGRFVAAYLADVAERGFACFNASEAAGEMARHAEESTDWLGQEDATRLSQAFNALAGETGTNASGTRPVFYPGLAKSNGLRGRSWFKNRLWTPGLELGYGSETFPSLREAQNDEERASELASLLDAIESMRTPSDAARTEDGDGE